MKKIKDLSRIIDSALNMNRRGFLKTTTAGTAALAARWPWSH